MSTDLARESVNAVLAAVEHADDGNAPNRVAEAAIAAAEERGRLGKQKEIETLRGALALANEEIRRLERGEFHCKCGKPITAEHQRCP